MTHSEGSYTLTYPDMLKDNVFLQRRREICYFANQYGMSVEDSTKLWISNMLWCCADKVTRDKIGDRAQRQQWFALLPHFSERTIDKWAAEYELLCDRGYL